jgi:hypothetical protein
VPRLKPAPTWAVTETFLLAFLVVHTQITKEAGLPGETPDDVDEACASTHS